MPYQEEALAALIGGTVSQAVRGNGTESFTRIIGEYAGLPVRFSFFFAPDITIEAKLPHDIGDEFEIYYIDNAADLAASQVSGGDPWDDNPKETYFLSQHAYLRANRSVIRTCKARWEALQGPGAEELLGVFEGGRVQSLNVGYVNPFGTGGEMQLKPDGVQHVHQCLDAFMWLLNAAAAAWYPAQKVEPARPMAPAGAAAAVGSQAPRRPIPTLAPGATVLVSWADGNSYLGVVIESNDQQCLCGFVDGREFWVPLAQLRAAAPPTT